MAIAQIQKYGSDLLNGCSRGLESIQSFKTRDDLVRGTMLTGLVGVATLCSWGAYFGLNYGSFTYSFASSCCTLAMANFYGGSDGAIKVFTDYFPKAFSLVQSVFYPPARGVTGIWRGDVSKSQFFDPRLSSAIGAYLNQKNLTSAYDFGCGVLDSYSKELREAYGINCRGLDGNKTTYTSSRILQDLSVPFEIPKRDCVISLEVGAKIPGQYEDQFIQNISNHAENLIIISWPVEGQKGPNQLNPRSNEYIIQKFKEKGWEYDSTAAKRLRENSHPIYYWYQDTLMVFRKSEEEKKERVL